MIILTPENLFNLKQELFNFDEHWRGILGKQPTTGVWVIYGKDKNGKTGFILTLARYLSTLKRVLYISGEEGTDPLFVENVKRSGITKGDKLGFSRFVSLTELTEKLKKRNAPKIVILDNATVYQKEFRNGRIADFIQENENRCLIIIVAHEEKNEPSTAAARYAKKMAKVYVQVKGLIAHVGGRCPGGQVIINDQKAALFGLTFNPNENN